MANLLSNTTIGGYQSIHTGNIGSYAITSLSGYATQSWVQSQGYVTGSYLPLSGGTMSGSIAMGGNNINSVGSLVNANGRIILYGNLHIDAFNGNAIYLQYYNQGVTTRIYGDIDMNNYNTTNVNIGYANNSFRAPIFYDSQNTSYYLDPNSTSNLNLVNLSTLNASDTNARYYYQSTNGVPSNNLGNPTVTEMALFHEQFNNKTAFYDPNSLSFWTSSDGVNFTEYTGFDTTTKKRFLGGDIDSGVNIPNLTNRFRIEVENSGGYVFLNQLYMYWSSNSHSTKVQIWVRRCDNNQWYQWTSSDQYVSSWPGHLYLPFGGIPFYPGALASSGHYNRIRIEFIPSWSSGTYSSTSISLMRMQIWGGYPAGKRNIYSTDQDQNVTFPAEVGSTSFYATDFRASNAYYLNGTSYYLNSTNGGIYTNARFETASNLVVQGSSYLGNGNGDEVHINDILRVGATDSGDAHFYFGEGGSAGSDYGSHWYWDSGYRFTWYTRNAGTDTTLFYYDTNSLSYITWGRSFSMNTNSIDYTGQLHFSGGTRFQSIDANYLKFRTDSVSVGGIQVKDGNETLRGYTGYFDGDGFGLLNSSGNWGIRLDPGNTGTRLFYAASEKFRTDGSGAYVTGRLDVSSYIYTPQHIIAKNIQGPYQVLNLDTIKEPGLYQYDGGIGGTQPEGVNQYNLRTIEIGNDGRYSQMAFDWTSDQVWFRRQTGATWFSWQEFIHSGNIGSQSVNYASTAGSLSSMNISQFTNNSGYITGYTETDTLATVTSRGATTSTPITVTASEGREVAVYMPSSYTTNDLVSGHEYGWYSDHWRLGMTRSAGAAGADFVVQWNGARRLSLTTGGNLTTTGIIYASGGDSTQWNTAYNWGNHASAGYLTSLPSHTHDDRYYTETESDNRYVPFSGATLTEGNYFYFRSNRGGYLGGLDSPSLQVYAEGGNAAFMSFHRGGNYAVNFGLDADNVMRIGGWSASSNRWVLDMDGNNTVAGSFRAPIFYDSANTNFYGDFASTSVVNGIRFGTSTNNATLTGNSDWGIRLTTDVGYIQFGPANSSYAHIYTDRDTFYFNRDILINGYSVITSSTIGSQSVSYATTAGSANSVSWSNVSGRPTNVSSFTNDSGYITSSALSGYATQSWVSGQSYQSASTAINTSNIGSQSVNYASSAGTSSNVTVNSGNGSASWYPIVWHSGNTLYSSSGTAQIYPAGGYIMANYFNSNDNDESGITRFLIKNGDSYHRSATTTVAANVIRGVASGTWSIDVTGSAGSVTWGNVSSKPSLLMYYQGFTLDANTMDGNSTGFTYSVNAPFTGPIARFSETGYSLQLNAAYSGGGTGIAFRTRNGDAGSFNPWRVLLNDANYTSYSPSLTGSGASGTWGINVTGSAGSVAWTNVSSRPTALSQFTNDLGNYGGFLTSVTAHSHAISDVTGLQSALDGKQAAGSYLTTSGKAADSNLLDGLDLHTGRNNEANKVVRTDVNGYIQAGWINTPSGAFTSTINKIYCSDDDYVRYQTPANFISNLGLITTGNIGSQSVSYATTAGTANSVAWTNVSSRPTALSQFSNDLGNYGGWLTTGGKAADSELIDGIDSSRIVYGNGARGKSIGMTGGSANTLDSANASGFYYGNAVTGMPTGDWWNWLSVTGNDWATSDGYAFQMAGSFWGDDFRLRRLTSGSWASWVSIIHSGNIGSQSVNYANSANSANTATSANQLSKYGYITNNDWNTYYINNKLIASSVAGHSGANRPTTSYDYGGMLSWFNSGEDCWQMYFPENSDQGNAAWKKLHYRTGWNGNFGPWRIVVDMVGNVSTIAGSNQSGLEIHSNVGYNQDPLTYFHMRGQADTGWKSLYVRLTGDAGGQDIEFRRIAENGANDRMFYIPRYGANQVIFDYPFVVGSDSRLKDNITPITNSLDKVMTLRGVEFDWNSGVNEGTHDVGLIAQDVEAVLPEAVNTQEDGYKNLAYTKVIPLLVEAMKEQQAMIDALKAEIELLKNR